MSAARSVAATTTAAPVLLGRCVTCKRTFRHDGDRLTAPWCDCRAAAGHPQTGVRWRTLTATTSARACNGRCEDSTSPVCVCSCGGRNHGTTWTPTDTTPARSAADADPAEAPPAETRRLLPDALDRCLRDERKARR